MSVVSLKELSEAIKKRPTHRWMIDHLDKLEVIELAFERIEAEFDAFKKACVIVPRKQLPENIHDAISKPFLEKFTFADRYYEKNELIALLAEIKDDIEKGILELLEG